MLPGPGPRLAGAMNTAGPLIIRGHGSHLGDGHVGLEALDFHIIRLDGQVGLAVGHVDGAGGRALRLGQLVLLLACLALRGSRKKKHNGTPKTLF